MHRAPGPANRFSRSRPRWILLARCFFDFVDKGSGPPLEAGRGILRIMSQRRPQAPEPAPEARPRWWEAWLALPLGVVAAAALWIGDTHLMRHDWPVGAVVFAVGMVATGLTVRLLRRAGLVR